MLKHFSFLLVLLATSLVTAQNTTTPANTTAPANTTVPTDNKSGGWWISDSSMFYVGPGTYTGDHVFTPMKNAWDYYFGNSIALAANRPWQTWTSTRRKFLGAVTGAVSGLTAGAASAYALIGTGPLIVGTGALLIGTVAGTSVGFVTPYIAPTWTPPAPLEKKILLGDREMYITPIEIHYDLDSIYQIDGVEFLAGYTLDAKTEYFGEFSGMAIYKDQKADEFKLTAVSDMGNYWECVLNLDATQDNQLVGFTDNNVGSMKGLGAKERDVEGLAILKQADGSLKYFLSHELDGKTGEVGPNQISVYKDSLEDANNRTTYKLDEIQSCKYNKGIEAIGLHPQLGTIVIHEAADAGIEDLHPLHQWKDMDFGTSDSVKSATASCLYKSTEGYEVSDVTFLSDGTMLVLERLCEPRWHGSAEDYQVIVRAVPNKNLTAALAPNQASTVTIEGKQIIYIDKVAPNEVLLPVGDNFECISAIEFPADANGNKEISIFLLTDDNRAPFQRTIMLQFKTDSQTLNDAMAQAFP